MNLDNQTLDQLDALQITTLKQSLLEANSGIAVTSSHRLFRNRLFAPRLFAPALWRGVGTTSAPLQITEIIGGWYIAGAAVGEAFTPGVSRITNHQLTGQGYAAGSAVGEGRQ